MTEDLHMYFEEVEGQVSNALKGTEFTFSFEEQKHSYVPLELESVEDAESKGILVTWSTDRTRGIMLPSLCLYSNRLVVSCSDYNAAMEVLDILETKVPDTFQSLQIVSTCFVDRPPK